MKQRRLRTTRLALSEEEDNGEGAGAAAPVAAAAAAPTEEQQPNVGAMPPSAAARPTTKPAPPIVRVGMGGGGRDEEQGEEEEEQEEEEDGPFATARVAFGGKKARRRARLHRSDAEIVLAGREQPAGPAGEDFLSCCRRIERASSTRVGVGIGKRPRPPLSSHFFFFIISPRSAF